ncbi:unnamed protein product [Dibothriocephalus latus]|uniref:G-protein coupled receptors family 1 profile domain-containing protein n=1 Tax=Dibothriocephalus latus TaxID=60516 RepID=A0A3P6TAB8_DIBLA|nr:unnamed protein product [Dibothriocephalus latus]
MSSNSTCDLFWDSYVRVEYNDTCNFDLVLPPEDIDINKFWASVILSVVGALFNLWAFILLIADYHAPISHDRRAATSQVTSAVGQHRVTTTSRSKKRSIMQVGLIVFCLFEVFYHTTQATGESIRLYSWLRLSRQVVPPPAGSSLPVEFAVLPITGSVFDCLRDAGICCRNWAITLITIARAEVVVWPLASQFYHRCLRKKRVFLAAIGLITALSLLLGVLRRLDRTIEVCYSSSFNSYCTTEKPFLMDLTKMTSFYFTYQTLLPWILIFIFTSLIIFKLKPWQKSSETFIHRHNPEAGKKGKAPDSHVRASIAVTVLAAFFTVFELPTFVLCIYFLVVDPNADLSNWTTAANIFLQLDSIANFFLLVLTMPSLRQRARYGTARPPGRSNMSQSDGIKLGETEVISNI